MELQSYQSGVKITGGKANVYLDPVSQSDTGIIILSDKNPSYITTDDRLIIEAPGEYEFQGVTIKGINKDGVISYLITVNDREVYFTTDAGVNNIPDDASLDAVIINVKSSIDEGKISKISYPVVMFETDSQVPDSVDASKVKSVNLKKITPEEKNIFLLQ